MKKFTQFINEGAVNAPKDNPAVISYNNVYESEAQPVNEFVSVVAGCALLWAFTTFVTGRDKGAGGAAVGGAAAGGLGTILALIIGKKIADKKQKKEEEKKKKEEEEKKKKEEEKKEKQAKLDRLFLAAKKQLENVKDKDSQEYKEAQQFVNCYTQAKIGDDGKPLTDPDEITERLKKIAGPELFAKFEKKGNEALRNEQIENMMKGLAITANNYTDDEVAQELKNEQNDAATLAVKAAEAKIQETNEKYDKQIKEAQEKGDDALVESLKAEKELKLKEAQEELKKAQATQVRVQKERELDAQREVLKEREQQLATAREDLARLQQQEADAVTAANGDTKKISEIKNNYKSFIEAADKVVKAKQKLVEETTNKITSLETELGSLANPSGGGGTPTPTTQQLAHMGQGVEEPKSDDEIKDELKKYYKDHPEKIPDELKKDGKLDEDKFKDLSAEDIKAKAQEAGIKLTKQSSQQDTPKSDDEIRNELKEYYSKPENKEKVPDNLKKDGEFDPSKLTDLTSEDLKAKAQEAGIKLTKQSSQQNKPIPNQFKDDDGNIIIKKEDGTFEKKERDGKDENGEPKYKDPVPIEKSEVEAIWGDIQGTDERNEGEDEEDKELNDDDTDNTGVETIDGKRKHINPAKIWHKRKKKNGGVTKSYYNKDGDSISEEEFHEKVQKFQARRRKAQQVQTSLDDLTPFQKFILEKTKPQASKKSTNEGKLLSDFLRTSLNK